MIAVVWAIVGVGTGALAWILASGRGFGLIGGILVGVIGAALGTWLLPRFGIAPAAGEAGDYFHATIGAGVLLALGALRVRPTGPGRMFMGFRPR